MSIFNIFKQKSLNKIEYISKDNSVKIKLPKEYRIEDITNYDFYAKYQDKGSIGMYVYNLEEYKDLTENQILYEQYSMLSKEGKMKIIENNQIRKYTDKTTNTVLYISRQEGFEDTIMAMTTVRFNSSSNYIVYIIQTCSKDDYERYKGQFLQNIMSLEINVVEKKQEENINVNDEKLNIQHEYDIPEGGDFNIYLKYDENINLNGLQEYLKLNNNNCEISIEKDNLGMWIGACSPESDTNISIEKYSFDDEFKMELIDEAESDEVIDILKKCDSNYFVDTHSVSDVIVLFNILLYISKQINDIVVFDNYNGVYLTSSQINNLTKR